MPENKKRILIAAIKSGSGKTLFTCGLLYLLKNIYFEKAFSTIKIASHKCGPDYIDPMFHRKVLGIPGTNLDPFFSDEADLKKTIAEDGADVTIIEGAMGIYDGITGMGKTGSCYDVAEKTGTPIILLIDAAGSGATIISVVKGILMDDDKCLIKGIIFNRMSDMYLETLKPDLNKMFRQIGREEIVLPGALPKSKGVQFESRHLGLVMPDETEDVLNKIAAFSEIICDNINMEELLKIAEKAENNRSQGAEEINTINPDDTNDIKTTAASKARDNGQSEQLNNMCGDVCRTAKDRSERADNIKISAADKTKYNDQADRKINSDDEGDDEGTVLLSSLSECDKRTVPLSPLSANSGIGAKNCSNSNNGIKKPGISQNGDELSDENIINIAEQTPTNKMTKTVSRAPILAIARDEAFCFYYEQNIKAFEERGVRIKYFSPLKDKTLPEGTKGILLGGGYPELFLKELSENESIKNEIKRAVRSGMPSLAECGGFMYLGEYIEDEKGVRHSMAGMIKGGAKNTGRLNRFGYITLYPEKTGLLKNPIRAHEFHYYDVEDSGSDCKAEKPGNGRTYSCMHMGENNLWGYPHLYYPSCPQIVETFIDFMK